MKSKFAIKAEVKKMRRLEKSTESNGIRASANSFALAATDARLTRPLI